MQFITVKTRKLLPPKDDIYKVLEESLPKLRDGDVVFITSKILAIHQGRTLPLQNPNFKKRLVKKEADYVLPTHKIGGHEFTLTIKDNTLIPSAGIDESNGNGYYILWPKNTQKLLKQIWAFLKKKYKLKNLGVVATDSHTTPLRWGVGGISTGFYGFYPTRDVRGTKDIFGRKLKVTKINLVDAYAGVSVLLMGEGGEQTPILVMRGVKNLKFTNNGTYKQLVIDPKQDIYSPLFKQFRKQRPSRR